MYVSVHHDRRSPNKEREATLPSPLLSLPPPHPPSIVDSSQLHFWVNYQRDGR